jgi:hypothetical protein
MYRALDRWQELWDTTVARSDPDKLLRSGFARHSGELCWLARKIVRAFVLGKEGSLRSGYLKKVGHASLDELHAFMKECREL